MRKFKLLAFALVIGTASLFATNGEAPKESNKIIRDQIVSLLQDADFIIENEMTVTITFTFSSEGEIVVLCAGCKDQTIVNYIRENLNYKKFDYPGVRDKIYKMPLKLKAA